MQDRIYSVKCPSCGTVHNGPIGYMSPHQGYFYCQKCTATVNINPDTGEIIPYEIWTQHNYYSKRSHYPGLYELEDKPTKFSPNLLVKAMFKPKEAFTELYHISSMEMGIALLIMFAVLTSTISFLAYQISGSDNIAVGMGSQLPISWVTLALISLPLAILSSLIMGWLAAKISEYFKGRNDFKKTIALMGYAGMPGFVIGILNSMIIASSLVTMPDYSDPMDLDINALLVYAAVIGVIGIISLIWGLIVYGSAVSVANNVSFGEGILCYLGAAILVGILSAILMVPLAFIMI